MKISFVIPCYCSEKTIKIVVSNIISTIDQKKDIDFEIITVNDKSPDNVWNVLKDISKNNQKVKAINLLNNTNKNGAIMAGLKYSTGDYVVICDDDGQSPVSKLWELLSPLENDNVDVSVAKYTKYKQNPLKKLTTFLNMKSLEIIGGVPKKIEFTNFIAIKRNIINILLETNNSNTYLEGMIYKITKNIVNVKLEEEERIEGSSNFTISKMTKLWLDEITEFSIRPLRIASLSGLIISFLGFIYLVVIIIQKILNIVTVEGYSSIMATLLFLGGMILMCLGIIGEYIGRIYININHIPQYVIKETINIEGKKDTNGKNE